MSYPLLQNEQIIQYFNVYFVNEINFTSMISFTIEMNVLDSLFCVSESHKVVPLNKTSIFATSIYWQFFVLLSPNYKNVTSSECFNFKSV